MKLSIIYGSIKKVLDVWKFIGIISIQYKNPYGLTWNAFKNTHRLEGIEYTSD